MRRRKRRRGRDERKVVSERIMRDEAKMRLRRNKTGPGACVLFTALSIQLQIRKKTEGFN